MRIICTVTGHQRSARRAAFDYQAQLWRSACKHCGEPMVRSETGDWTLAQSLEQA